MSSSRERKSRDDDVAFRIEDEDGEETTRSSRTLEKANLDGLNPVTRNRIITDLSRALLFKGLSKDRIDWAECIAEANAIKEGVGNAALDEAAKRLEDVFGFGVRRIPAKMEEDLPSRFGDRLYLINSVDDSEDGTHSLHIHSADAASSFEKGVLIMILAFAYCKGSARVSSGRAKGAGKITRWITERDLYSLLHEVDKNIPREPPGAEGRSSSMRSLREGAAEQTTPDVDTLLEQFVRLDYLLRDRVEPEEIEEPSEGREGLAGEDKKEVVYAMGPRAVMEIGRKQVVYFCSNVLDEMPDPTMLAEIEEGEESISYLLDAALVLDDSMSRCAACGQDGDDLKTCAACKMVKYCDVQCQEAHHPKHKKECRKCAALFNKKLFKDTPPNEDCPICFLPLPIDNSHIYYQTCCGKTLCSGCFIAVQEEESGNTLLCPFCREKPPNNNDSEHLKRLKKRMEANDHEAFVQLGHQYLEGLSGLPQDSRKAFELWSRAAQLGSVCGCSTVGDSYRHGWVVGKDVQKAVNYYQLAAMAGDVSARYKLGCVELQLDAGNIDRALKHWMIAARAGDVFSLSKVKEGYRSGHVTKDAYAKTLRAHQKSVNEMKSDKRDRAEKIRKKNRKEA